MSEKTKNVLLAVLIVGLVSMTVAYAALSQTLNINGSAQVAGSSNWNIHFDTAASGKQAITTSGYASVGSGTIQVTPTLVTTPLVTLKAPGDSVEFRFTIENEGQIAGLLTNYSTISLGTFTYTGNDATNTALKTELEGDIHVSLTYDDNNKTAITANSDTIAVGATKDLVLTIWYEKDENNEQHLPENVVSIPNISASMTYTQTSSN